MVRSTILALLVLVGLLAAPAWFPATEAQDTTPLEDRITQLEDDIALIYDTVAIYAEQSLPPLYPLGPQEPPIPAEAFTGPYAFVLYCQQGPPANVSASVRGQYPSYCVRPGSSVSP